MSCVALHAVIIIGHRMFCLHRKAVALYSNVGEEGDELLFNQGDVLTVIEQLNNDWLMCQLGNESGIVPANYVKLSND